MPRRNGNKKFKLRRNKGAHQRRRTTRGHRQMSKFKKYRAYAPVGKEGE
jgi:hypothetical protein